MPREISIAKSKKLAKDIKWAQDEVARVRALALAKCKADPKGRCIDGRAGAIRGYLHARGWVRHFRLQLDSSVVVKGVTQHYTGAHLRSA